MMRRNDIQVVHGFKTAVASLTKLLFPDTCCHCGERLVGEQGRLCTRCQLHLPVTDYAVRENNVAEQRLAGRIPFVAATSYLTFIHGNVTQSIIHSIKYRNSTELARIAGNWLGASMQESDRFNDVDIIVPVPLHRRKQRRRGYNQSILICHGIVETFPHPVMEDCLIRHTYTSTQTHLSRSERSENMKGVFSLQNAHKLDNKHILLVDDVLTTGATIEACWSALKKIQGVKISVATLAIASDV